MHYWEDGTLAIKATLCYWLGYIVPFAFTSGRAYNRLERYLFLKTRKFFF